MYIDIFDTYVCTAKQHAASIAFKYMNNVSTQE